MRATTMFAAGLAGIVWAAPAAAQPNAQQALAQRFASSGLQPGLPFPAVGVHDADGRHFDTRGLKGSYTVIVGGCLT